MSLESINDDLLRKVTSGRCRMLQYSDHRNKIWDIADDSWNHVVSSPLSLASFQQSAIIHMWNRWISDQVHSGHQMTARRWTRIKLTFSLTGMVGSGPIEYARYLYSGMYTCTSFPRVAGGGIKFGNVRNAIYMPGSPPPLLPVLLVVVSS